MTAKKLTDKQQYWLAHLQRCQELGQSLSDYAKAHELDLKALYNWKWMLSQRGMTRGAATTSALFSQVKVAQRSSDASTPIQIQFPNGCLLRCEATDEATLRALTSALLSVS